MNTTIFLVVYMFLVFSVHMILSSFVNVLSC